MTLSANLTHVLCLYICALLLYRCVKAVRGLRGALSENLSAKDCFYLLATIPLGALSSGSAHGIQVVVLQVLLFGLGLLLWLDAILFVQYRIEVSPQTIGWFFSGKKGVLKGWPYLLKIFEKAPIAIAIPLCWAMSLSYLSGPPDRLELPLLPLIYAAALTFIIRKNVMISKAYTAALITVMAIAFLAPMPEPSKTMGVTASTLTLIFLLTMLAYLFLRRYGSSAEFRSTPSLIPNILKNDQFTLDRKTVFEERHLRHLSPKTYRGCKTAYFGSCKRANVILLTVESLGCYIDPYPGASISSKVVEKFFRSAWRSEKHFCLCPNTTVATNQIYSGFYSNNPYNKPSSKFPGEAPVHVQTLKESGYKTLFLDTADISLFNYERLLTKIGFDKIWGDKHLLDDQYSADYRIWEMVDEVATAAANGPFFLHVINDQTHLPYKVIDHQRFNRHERAGEEASYLNALEEVDYVLAEFISRLSGKIDMENTLLVLTGDHGEAFGDFGYHFHSNSVVYSQLLVPFFMSHPQLTSRVIPHSNHFDLFPTFFDLLGIEANYPTLGSSMCANNRELAYFVHSATLKGNTPANFGFVSEDGLLWMDRLFNRVSRISHENAQLPLSSSEKKYAASLLGLMLEERHLLG